MLPLNSRRARLSVPLPTLAAEQFNRYVDSVNGSDTNNGQTPATAKATIAGGLAVLTAGMSLGLARGSTFSAATGDALLTVPYSGFRLGVYGSGAAPVFEGRKQITSGWGRQNAGLYPNVWSQILTPPGPSTTASETSGLWIDGVRPTYRANEAAIEAAGEGWNSNNRAGLAQRVYVYSTVDPATDGKTYLFTWTNYGISGHSTILAAAARRAELVGPMEFVGFRGHYNAVAGGTGSQKQLLLREGNVHHTVTEAELVEDQINSGWDVSLVGQSPYTAYKEAGAGFGHTARRVLVIGDSASRDVISAFTAHGSTTVWDSVTYEQCVASYCNSGGGAYGTFEGVFNLTDFAALDCRVAVSTPATAVTIDRLAFKQGGANTGNASVGFGNSSTATRTLVIRDSVLSVASALSFTGFVDCNQQDGTLLIENCVLYAPSTSNLRAVNVRQKTSGGLTVTVRNCVFVLPASQRQITLYNPQIVYVGTNNHFVDAGSYFEIGNGSGSYTVYTGPANWHTALVALGNGSSETGYSTGAPGWLGDPATGDFRLDPSGVAGLAGRGQRYHLNRVTRALVAGGQDRWDVPPATLAEQRAYVADPTAWNWYP